MRAAAWVAAVALVVAPGALALAQTGDLVLSRNTADSGMGPVIFPHWAHRLRFTCNVCHDALFPMKAGESNIDMDALRAGKFCGRCHNGRIAWDTGVQNCTRCHRVE